MPAPRKAPSRDPNASFGLKEAAKLHPHARKNDSNPTCRRIKRGICAILLICPVLSGVYGETLFSLHAAELRVVRADLQSEMFLDPLPFDVPFIIVGRAPHSARSVMIRFEEFIGESVVFGKDPRRIETFRVRANAILDVMLADGRGSFAAEEIERLRGRLIALVIETAGSRSRFSPSRLAGTAPWNWSKWSDSFENTEPYIIAPGTVFDPDPMSGASAIRFAERINTIPAAASEREREATRRALIEAIVFEARAVRIARVSRPRTPVRVSYFREYESSIPDTTAAAPSQSHFSSRMGREKNASPEFEYAKDFSLFCPPLKANRRYMVDFVWERKLSENELEAFGINIRRKMREAAVRHPGEGFRPDGATLAALIAEALEDISGDGPPAIPASAVDLGVSLELARTRASWAPVSDEIEFAETDADRSIDALASELRSMIQEMKMTTRTSILADITPDNTVNADLGQLYAEKIGKGVPYLGFNFYLRPINKEAPLRTAGGFMRRFSMTCGLTLTGVEDEEKTRESLFQQYALTVGAGYRITRSMRVGGGALVFRELNPKTFPLVREMRLAYTPYVSASFDMDMEKRLKMIGGLFSFLEE